MTILSAALRFGTIAALFAIACTTTIRLPPVPTAGPECIDESSAQARRAFERRLAERTVIVRASRYSPGRSVRVDASSGALIGPRGLVLAAYHTVMGSELITATFRTFGDDMTVTVSREVPMLLIVFDPHKDVAVLVPIHRDVHMTALPVRREPIAKNDRLFFLGAGTTARGSSVLDDDAALGGTRGFATFSAPNWPEDDGAPVFNACGEVVGTVIRTDQKRELAHFLPTDESLRLLNVTSSDLQ